MNTLICTLYEFWCTCGVLYEVDMRLKVFFSLCFVSCHLVFWFVCHNWVSSHSWEFYGWMLNHFYICINQTICLKSMQYNSSQLVRVSDQESEFWIKNHMRASFKLCQVLIQINSSFLLKFWIFKVWFKSKNWMNRIKYWIWKIRNWLCTSYLNNEKGWRKLKLESKKTGFCLCIYDLNHRKAWLES